ncbi:hypothetical protein HHL22_11015 [Hymenobacter sp. RP-2-7]|uniref:Curlin-associated protein n=1 Tax=Hymenobacter polaris TaxID=2682546 RepID=A0A7Y0AEB4_9BACT|nr:hypothetical protein [Hymenobacter polaris]NML65736.1 hypothetical protein [Hymenobacter polaris]
MKTLNHRLLLAAAALFSASYANAQIASSSIGATPGPNNLPSAGGFGYTSPNATFTRNVTTIEQAGTNQYGSVMQSGDQTSIGRQNEATLTQVASSAAGGHNNAFQSQTNDASGGGSANAQNRAANRMEATQSGDYSVVNQTQRGSGNKATALQTAGSYSNLLTQNQLGVNNQAYSEQRGSYSRSTQTQNGQNNQGVVIQTSPSYNNIAEQTQTGDNNRAYAGQGTMNASGIVASSGYNTSMQTQTGSGNFSRNDQFGSDDQSYVRQNGTTNTAAVTQH